MHRIKLGVIFSMLMKPIEYKYTPPPLYQQVICSAFTLIFHTRHYFLQQLGTIEDINVESDLNCLVTIVRRNGCDDVWVSSQAKPLTQQAVVLHATHPRLPPSPPTAFLCLGGTPLQSSRHHLASQTRRW